MADGKQASRIFFDLDGNRITTKDTSKIVYGGDDRSDNFVSNEGSYHYKEKPMPFSAEAIIVETDETDIELIRNWKGTLSIENDVGTQYVVKGAHVSNVIEAEGGDIKVMFAGPKAIKV